MADWDSEQLAQHIGYLPQDCGLLPGTISENVSRFAAARGVPQAVVDEEVVNAARMAGVHDMILHLPGGYDTYVEGNGHRLSAGQAQRVALRSEEHTSELQSLMRISYAVFCLKKKKQKHRYISST